MLRIKNDRHVLFLQPHRLVVFSTGVNRVSRSWKIVDDKLPDELSVYLLANNRAVFDLLVDLAEEECHLESLPDIGARDTKHYIGKIRDKYFSNSMFSATVRSKVKKDAAVLISGISHNLLCEKLLEKLNGTESILRSIHTPVTLAPKLCQRLDLNSGAQLMALRVDKQSFRLIASVDGFVVLNRRVEFIESAQQGLGDALVTSISETLIYLDRKSISGWVSPTVNLVAESSVDRSFFDEFKDVLGADSKFEFNHVFPNEGEWIGEAPAVCERAGQLLSSVLKTGADGYQQQSHTKGYTARRIRHVSFALALSLFCGAVSTAAMARKIADQYSTLSVRYDKAELFARDNIEQDKQADSQQVEAVRQALATARFTEIRAQGSPTVFLSQLSSVIGSHPAVSIVKVSWERDDLLDDKSLRHILGQSENTDGQSAGLVYKALVSGAIGGSAGSALDTFEAFILTLRQANASSSVVVVDAPYGVSQNSRTTISDLTKSDGNFTIEISTQGVAR